MSKRTEVVRGFTVAVLDERVADVFAQMWEP